MKQLLEQLNTLQSQINDAITRLGLDDDRNHLSTLDKEMINTSLWDDPAHAEAISKSLLACEPT